MCYFVLKPHLKQLLAMQHKHTELFNLYYTAQIWRFGWGGGSIVVFSLFSVTHQSTCPCLHISALGVLLIEKEVTEFVIEMRIIDILLKSRRKPLIQ